MALPSIVDIPLGFTSIDFAKRFNITTTNAGMRLRDRVRDGLLNCQKALAQTVTNNQTRLVNVYTVPGATMLDWKYIDYICAKRVTKKHGSIYVEDLPLRSKPTSVAEYQQLWNVPYKTTENRLRHLRLKGILKSIRTGNCAYYAPCSYKTLACVVAPKIIRRPASILKYIKFWNISYYAAANRLYRYVCEGLLYRPSRGMYAPVKTRKPK